MKRQFLIFLFLLFFTFGVSAQTEKAELFDEFGELNCEDILARSDGLFSRLQQNPTSIAYIIYYEGNHSQQFYDKKLKKLSSKEINPRRGEALNKAKSITLYLTKWRKAKADRFILIDGGYSRNYRIEIWIAPLGAEKPTASPDLEEKDVKFRKGKTPPVADCQGYYNSI